MQPHTDRRYLLGLLTIILAFNFLDRIALGLVTQDIKTELHLSDTQLGFLGGVAFALFYAAMGIPIGRWADRGNRVTIIGLSTAIWSAAVALCAIAGTFLQLVLIRVVVGVGEAGCVPPAHSLIADFFTRAQRPRAVSIYMQGVSLSLIVGPFAAGWLNQLYGWRAMFAIIGLPGVILALLTQFSLREPRRDYFPAALPTPLSHPDVKEVCVTLWDSATFRHVLSAFSVICFFTYGRLQWMPAFFVRSFGLKTGELGTWFAAIYGIGGLVGTYCGGEWAARRAANNERLQLKAMGVFTLLSGGCAACVYLPALAPNYYWALGWLALSNTLVVMINGPTFAVLQTLVPARMRAMSIALVFLFINLVGMGCGPWAAGALSDALRPMTHDESLRYAMLFLCPASLWGAWHLWRAARTVARDVDATLVESAG